MLSCIACLALPTPIEAGPPSPAKAVARAEKVEPLPERPAAGIISAIRRLSELQQLTVLGDRVALSQQVPLAQKLKSQLLAASENMWASAHARHELLKHVLSGGDPTVLGKLLDRKVIPEAELALARGAFAYAVGDRQEAAEHLQNVDFLSLNPSLGGHIALVRAVLTKDADKRAALALTDVARLLSPGTVVEETALRLAIELSIANGERILFERSIMRYFTRFPASLYAEAIHARIAGVLALTEKVGTQSGLTFLTELSAVLSPQRRRSFYAKVAEAALRGGKLETAEQAARLARGNEAASDPAATKLVAIEAAALPFGTRRAEALRLLDLANTTGKSSETGELIATTRALVDMIDEPLQTAPPMGPATNVAKPAPGRPSAAEALNARAVKVEALTAKANASISAAEKLLAEVKK